MQRELIFLTFSVACFVAFVLQIVFRFDVQKSISDSYYRFKEYGQEKVFAIGIAAFSFPMFFVGGSVFMPLAAGLIGFVGAAASFNDRLQTKIVHYVGAVLGITFGLIDVIICYEYWIPVLIATILALLIKFLTKNWLWWIEILFYFTIISCKYFGIIQTELAKIVF